MSLWIFVSGIIAPAIFWIVYFYYKDRYRPEPMINIGLSYISGILAAFICLNLYRLLPLLGFPEDISIVIDNNRPLFLGYCLAVVGPLEEICKFIPYFFIIKFVKVFDERIDCFIYSSVIALGFASFENIQYFSHMQGLELLGRAVATPLTHTIFSSLWGFTVGRARLNHRPLFLPALTGLTIAAIFHGAFNFFTMITSLRLLSAVLILVIWIWRLRLMDMSVKEYLIRGKKE